LLNNSSLNDDSLNNIETNNYDFVNDFDVVKNTKNEMYNLLDVKLRNINEEINKMKILIEQLKLIPNIIKN